jgi:cellobiose-specific phosphotransferase system component IIA
MKKVTIKLPDAMYEVIMKSGDSKNYLIKAIQNGEVCDEDAKGNTVRSTEAGDIRGD